MKLTRLGRLSVLFSCALMITPAFGGELKKPAGEVKKTDVAGGDLLGAPPQRDATRATTDKGPLRADQTRASEQTPIVVDTLEVKTLGQRELGEQSNPTNEDFSALERDLQGVRRRSRELRRQHEELRELRERDPAEFERRVREENRKLDERGRPQAGGIDESLKEIGRTIDEEGRGRSRSRDGRSRRDDRTRAKRSADRAPDVTRDAPRDGRRGPIEEIPTDPYGRPLETVTDATPVPGPSMDNRAPVLVDPVSGGVIAAPGEKMSWWKVFLLKLMEYVGKGLSLLLGRQMGEVNDNRAAIVDREAGTDAVRRADVDARVNAAINEGWSDGALRQPPASIPTADTSRAPIVAPDTSRAPNPVTRSMDPITGSERAIVEIPLGGLGGP